MVFCRPLSSGEEKQQGESEENADTGFETMTVSKQDITLQQSYPAQRFSGPGSRRSADP